MLSDSRLAYLLKKYLTQDLNSLEDKELNDWRLEAPENEAIIQGLNKESVQEELDALTRHDWLGMEARFRVRRGAKPAQIRFLPFWKYTVAAAVVVALALGGWNKWMGNRRLVQMSENIAVSPGDVAPGRDRAMLTLADGREVNLDSVSKGLIAAQGTIRIVKQKDGSLSYEKTPEGNQQASATEVYNNLRTPNGGQYQLLLPDGSHVFINNASSLRYPVAFTGSKREVFLSGEAFFDVVKDGQRPFIVHTGKEEVEVLGTSFDVAAYPDTLQLVRTVLVDGSVKVDFNHKTALLKPGQQATSEGNTLVVENANIRSATAWKSGFFSFDNASGAEILKQLSRWYDVSVNVDIQSPINKRHLIGRMSRDLTLQQALKILQEQNMPLIYNEHTHTIEEKK